jgi:hypothetical protein
MNNNFSLFDSYPFLSPLSADEALCVHKLLKSIANNKDHIPKINLPEKLTDHMILCFIKAFHDKQHEITPKAWVQFLEALFANGLDSQIHNPTLRNYLLIEMAKKYPLSRYIDLSQRLNLAYSALHGGINSRKVLMEHAKHFELDDEDHLKDIAFKGILLGSASHFDIHQFMPQSLEVAKQFIFMIGRLDKQKAESELQKLEHYFPHQISTIRDQLKAC